MDVINICVAGVGGQGLVLTTRIIAGVAFHQGLDVKTTDVVGLAQRGGMVWSNLRLGPRVHSPLIPRGQGDFLVAVEELEGLRWAEGMKPGALVILSHQVIYPNRVLLEQEQYPVDVAGELERKGLRVVAVDAPSMAREMGNVRLANTVLLGILSRHLPLEEAAWREVIAEQVPPRTVQGNLAAFDRGRQLVDEAS